MSAAHRSDLLGRLVAMLVFCLGVGLLLLVFKIAYGLFTATPASALGINITGDPKRDPGVALIGQSFGFLIIKILLLFVMSAASSMIAQRGINLYFSCVHGSKPDNTTKPAANVSAEA